ncbi:hypothetical protein [Devosia sp.]|uniref:hypothetical protein n=1 Tax=Devosia sp. TaxID=1871048 RepID=UPI0035B095E3
MLPPILEIYVVWHPKDTAGASIAAAIVDHFHGTPFTGLIGGAIEVLVRTEPWDASGVPRPLPLNDGDLPHGLERSAYIAIVPLIGNEMAMAVGGDDAWRVYAERMRNEAAAQKGVASVFPYTLNDGAMNGTDVGAILGGFQRVGAADPEVEGEDAISLLCRDLTQGLAQELSSDEGDRLQVFISHTKHARKGDEEDTRKAVDLVRDTIAKTRLRDFFDMSDLQPGRDWDKTLRDNAATSALLAIRTDLYPSREWCQREVRISNESGMPVIFMDAPGPGEERGSFLMDHVPRIPVGKTNGEWNKADVYRALNALVDESLKRVLWRRQKELSEKGGEMAVGRWAPHAPEPVTLLAWLSDRMLPVLRSRRRNTSWFFIPTHRSVRTRDSCSIA